MSTSRKKQRAGSAGLRDRNVFSRPAIRLLSALESFAGEDRYHWTEVRSHAATKAVWSGPAELQRAFIMATVERISRLPDKMDRAVKRNLMGYANLWHERNFPKASVELAKRLLRRKLAFSDDEVAGVAQRLARLALIASFSVPIIGEVVGLLEEHADAARKVPAFAAHLSALQAALEVCGRAAEQRLANRLGALRAPPRPGPIFPGEAWSDAALAELARMPAEERDAWLRLLAHCQHARGGAPSSKWLTRARQLLKEVGPKGLKRRMVNWFALVNQPRTQPIREWHRDVHPDPNQLIIEPHADILKGLAWTCGLSEDKAVARALTALALSAYRRIPFKGPREVKVGNACVTALGIMPGSEGVYQLALLKVKVKFGTAQNFVAVALDRATQRSASAG